LLKSICWRSSAGRSLFKTTWTGGSASRVMTEDGGVGVGLDGVAICACAVSDTSALVGIAEADIVVKVVDSSIGTMEGIAEVGDWRGSEGDWLTVDVGKVGAGIGVAFCGEAGRDRVGVRSVESCRGGSK
jgi:hypothetical protein